MLESAGFDVVDLGVDLPEDRFIEAYGVKSDAKIIALSALLTTTMPAMESSVAKLNARAFSGSKIKVLSAGRDRRKFAEQIAPTVMRWTPRRRPKRRETTCIIKTACI